MLRYPLLSLMLLFTTFAFADADMQGEAQKVLDKLYETNGNEVFEKPRIEIIEEKKHGALYIRSQNKIELSEKAYAVCQSFGDNFSSALAFIIGHELSHAFQKARKTSFLHYQHYHNSNIWIEESADIQGALMAALSGYNTLDLMPEVIDKIYAAFALSRCLKGYPCLDERKKTAKKVQKKARELLALHKAGVYSLSIGKYGVAIACFQYIKQWYPSVAVYNNLGTAMALKALNLTEEVTKPYVFPLEIHWENRIKLLARGEIEVPPTLLATYENCLQQAMRYFKIAAKMRPRDMSIKSNQISVWILNQQEKKALKKGLKWLKKSKFCQNKTFKLALALAFAFNEKSDKAIKIWKEIMAGEPSAAAIQAQTNFQLHASNRICLKTEPPNCLSVDCIEKDIDNIRINRPTSYPSEGIVVELFPNAQVKITTKKQSIFYRFDLNGESFALQRVLKKCAFDTDWDFWNHTPLVLSEVGGITACPCDGLAFKLDADGGIEEWVKFY